MGSLGAFLLTHYLWLKALHIIAVISWMAGLLYLPRLFAYHADAKSGSALDKTFQVMERRLLRIIMNPALIISWLLGLLLLLANPALLGNGWMHVKLTALILLTGLHMVFARWRKTFVRSENTRPARFYKLWNEAPTVLMVLIIIMAVAEPF